jgi:hypothetical protein
MKTNLIASLSLLAITAFAHMGVELGPNKGRLLEFSKNETMHGEVTVKDGHFHIALLDKDLKPVLIKDQVLTATHGDRSNPVKLEVRLQDGHFVVPQQKGDDYWIIFQFRTAPGVKPITARLHYQAEKCEACGKPEWLCECTGDK